MVSQPRIFKYIDIFSYIFLVLNIVAIPLFVDKHLVNAYIIPKQYIFGGIVLVNLFLVAVKMVLTKRLEYRSSATDVPALLLLGVSVLSAIFSAARYDSLIGRNEYFILNVLFLAFSVTFYLILTNHLTTSQRWQGIVDALVAVGALTACVFLLKAIFHVDLAVFGLPSTWNSTDGLNGPFGLWLVIIFIVSAGYLIKKTSHVGRILLYFFATLVSFTCLILLSFKILWWLLLVGLVLLLLIGSSMLRESRLGWLSILFATLIGVVIFIVFNTPKSVQTNVPPEVSLGARPSFAVTYATALSGVKNFLIGSGLGSFGVDFSQFRSADFNNDSVAWSLRFSQPFSTVLALIAEGGILTILVFALLVLLVVGHVLTAWVRLRLENRSRTIEDELGRSGGQHQIEVLVVAVAWLVATVGMAVLFYGPVLWWTWWLLLGLVTSGLAFINKKMVTIKYLTIEDTPQYNLAFSFGLIVVMAAAILLGVWGVKLYMGEAAYAAALQSSTPSEAEAKLKQALESNPNADLYYVAIAQTYLTEAAELSRRNKPDVSVISNLVAEAVNAARRATDLSPRSTAIWANLATMYENAALLLPEAHDWAIKSLQAAKNLEPTNPVLAWRLGNNYALGGQKDEAIKAYEEAVRLKKDYIGAYSGLAAVYEQSNQIDKAAETYRTVLLLGGDNIDALYNFGRLLFNRNRKGDRADAEKIWLEVVRRQPTHSNALYSLGLLYENRGDKTQALQYYYKVKDLNPGNQEITNKINTLVNNR